jgi:hypothetical protein
MCNRYETPEERAIERFWHVGRDQPNRWWDEIVVPRRTGVFIRSSRNAGQGRAGQGRAVSWWLDSGV